MLPGRVAHMIVVAVLQVVATIATATAVYYARATVSQARTALGDAHRMHEENMLAQREAASLDTERQILGQFQRVADDAGAVLETIASDEPLRGEGAIIPTPRRFPARARQLFISATILERLAGVELPTCRALVAHHNPTEAKNDAIGAILEVETTFRNWDAAQHPS
jgi:hypothetical protein